AVVGGGADESVSALTARAEALDSERVVLMGPAGTAGGLTDGIYLAAAAAGAIAGESDPAVPLGGAALGGITAVSAAYTDTEINTLVRGGVTPVECVGGTVSVVRGVTTRTTTAGVPDATWRELSTILIVDSVIPSIRNSLRAKFARTKNTAQQRGAIRSQVILELEDKKTREIITDYGSVGVSVSASSPTVCQVEFSFAVAHGLNQIILTAHITV
ncbi:MAG TPA: phage tail sheath C-terminal domain-containing protein, partial [Oscillospiraceae bacterium]|nr:phage tail sheath C-terminal domain-containing protein [Oscillospiraceae bacterium]